MRTKPASILLSAAVILVMVFGFAPNGSAFQMGGAIQGTPINVEPAVVSNLAGSAGAPGSTDAIGTAARFDYPEGMTTDGTNLFVMDSWNHTIRKIVISTGVVTTIAGSAGSSGSSDGTGTSARFSIPHGITTDGTNLFVADTSNHTIRKIVISTGVVTTIAGTAGSPGSTDDTGSSARFYVPQAITTDGTNLFVADNANHTVRKIVISTGVVTTIAGTAGSSGSTDGTGSSARFYMPYGITTDGTSLFVADQGNHTIRKIVISTGVVTTIAGTAGSPGSTDGTGTSAKFDYSSGITTDGTNLFVADTINHTVRKIVISTGVVTTIAGTAGSSGSTDDTGTAARFYNPNGITTDGTSLFVADTYNHTIRKISDASAGGSSTNLLLNPGFESGNVNWTESYLTTTPDITNNSTYAHTGSWFAWFGGYSNAIDSIYQDVTIPSTSQQPYLQFWYYIATYETTTSSANDKIAVEIRKAADNTLLATLVTLSNLDKTSGYVQSQQYDLSAFKGQTIRLRFSATTNSSLSTSFFIDDVSIDSMGSTSVCTYSISPTSQTFTSSGGTASVTVTASDSSCVWTATESLSWVSITSGSKGTGSGTVIYSISANTSKSTRTGNMTIAGKAFTITQTGSTPTPACTFSISPASKSFGPNGGSGSVTVTASSSSCSWTATESLSWVSITSGSSGKGSGTVIYSVSANTSKSTRTGNITIAGKAFTITQTGYTPTPACTYSISPTSKTFNSQGGTGSVTVTASATTCAWTAAESLSWVSITSGSKGTGSGTVIYSVSANTSTSPRTGFITIAGQTFEITQEQCWYCGGGGGNYCPASAPLRCAADRCCPYGQNNRTDVCCNNNPPSSGCTSNGICGGGGGNYCDPGWCLNTTYNLCCPKAYPWYWPGGYGLGAGCYANCAIVPLVDICSTKVICWN